MRLFIRTLALAVAAVHPAIAEEPATFCARITRSELEGPFERRLAGTDARLEASGIQCRWTLGDPGVGQGEIVLRLDTGLLPSVRAARQSILMARLPEERHGRVVEALTGVGDDGVVRRVTADGTMHDLQFEAVKGRRRFVLDVTPRPDPAVGLRLYAQAHDFLRRLVNGGRLDD